MGMFDVFKSRSCYNSEGKFSLAKLYNAFVVVESLILLGCSLYGVFKFKFDEPVITMTLVVGVYINIYLLFFSLSSLQREDSFQMFLSALSHVFLTIMSTLHYWQQPEHHAFNTALLVMWITASFCQLVYIPLTYLIITEEFGDLIFRTVGTDVEQQGRYKQGLILFATLKFDTFLSLLCLLLASVRLVDKFVAMENFLNIGSCIYNIIWASAGYLVIKQERSCGIWVWSVFGLVGQPIYLGWKAVMIWTSGFYSDDLYPKDAKILFMVAASSWLFVHAFVILWALIKVRNNFGHGLIELWDQALRADARDQQDKDDLERRRRMTQIAQNARKAKNQDLYGSGLHYSMTTPEYAQANQHQQQHQQQQRDVEHGEPSINTHHPDRQPLLSGRANHIEYASTDMQ